MAINGPVLTEAIYLILIHRREVARKVNGEIESHEQTESLVFAYLLYILWYKYSIFYSPNYAAECFVQPLGTLLKKSRRANTSLVISRLQGMRLKTGWV